MKTGSGNIPRFDNPASPYRGSSFTATAMSDHFLTCEHCGGKVDERDLGALLDHRSLGHTPERSWKRRQRY